MRKKVIVFGIKDLAELATFYIKHDHDDVMWVRACTIDGEFMQGSSFKNFNVVPFEEVTTAYPPDDHAMFIPMTQLEMGKARLAKYLQAKEMGYELINLISPRATVYPGSIQGDNNFIFEDNTIQPFVTVGSNNILWSGNHIGHHSTLHNNIFITSQVVVSGHCVIQDGCYLGVNSTIRDGVILAEESLVGMGAVIGKNTEAGKVYTVPNTKARENDISINHFSR